MDQKNRDKALESALSNIEKQFGKGSLMKLGDDSVDQSIEAISTGSIGLDAALGIGGLPKGRVVEIYGPESSGKTTLTLQVVAECQKDWYIKWVSSIILMISLLLTANNLFPYNLFVGVFGFVGWVIVAILWKDRSLILLNTTSLVIYINGIIGYLVDK